MTEEFYLKHKDKSWELPKFPDDDIDETSASQVVNWVFNEMKAGNMGWLEVNLLNVKGGDFIPIGYHHMGQIETQVLDHRNLYKPQSNNVSECFMVKDKKWVPETCTHAANIEAFWQNDFPFSSWSKIRFVKLDPHGSLNIQEDHIQEEIIPITTEDFSSHTFHMICSIKEPGKKCKLIVEDFGELPLKEGKIYLLNPYRKYVMVNTSETESSIRIQLEGVPGTRFGEFLNCLTRSFFEIEGRLGKDYLRHYKQIDQRSGPVGVMDY